MQRWAAALATGLALCAGTARAQEMYRWLDAHGGVHFGSEPPADARSVEPWSPDSGRLRIESPSPAEDPGPPVPAAAAARPIAPPPEAEEERLGGRTEAEWRRQSHQLEGRVRDLENQIEELEESTQAYGGWGTHRDSNGMTQRVSVPDQAQQLEKQLRQAESELEALEEEARRLGVPPGWLR
jgi:hypothetical protein